MEDILNILNLAYTSGQEKESGSDLYVISIDGHPMFYVQTLEKTKEKTTEILDRLSIFSYDSNYTIIKDGDIETDNEFRIYKAYKYYVISYDTLVHTVRYNIIKEII